MKQIKEVEKELCKLKPGKQPSPFLPENYIGSEYGYYSFLNVRVPQLRERQKRGYSFSVDPIQRQWQVWDAVWQGSNVFEAALSAAHFVNKRPIKELYAHKHLLLVWVERVDNWALSDELSNIWAKLLEHSTREFLPQFKKWNHSTNPWKVRLSMVGLLYYSQMRKKYLPFNTIVNFVKPHIHNQHYYVQKAVGWTLRECWNVYPQKTYKYLTQIAAEIPAGGWTAATEKLSKEDKSKLKAIRTRNKKQRSPQVKAKKSPAKKVQLKTSKTGASPMAFLNSIQDEQLRKDSKKLLKVFKDATGMKPKMWGDSIVGFGQYTYKRANGQEADFMACGFSPRKSGPTLYIMPGYSNYQDLMKDLGPHKLGKSCLYLKSLDGVDLTVVSRLVKAGLKDLKKKYKTNY
jgi:3-methyladenine DNA glycosylase AlkD